MTNSFFPLIITDILSILLMVCIALKEILPDFFFALQSSASVISLQNNFYAHTFSFRFLPSTEQLVSDSSVVKTSCLYSLFLIYSVGICALPFALYRSESWVSKEKFFSCFWQFFVTSGAWQQKVCLMGQLLVAPFSVTALFQASGSKILNSVCHSTDADLGGIGILSPSLTTVGIAAFSGKT